MTLILSACALGMNAQALKQQGTTVEQIVPEGWEDFKAGVRVAKEDKSERVTKSSDYLLMYFTWWLISFVEYGPEICDGIDYDEFSRAQSAHGAFLDHRAVCMGFSRALQMLCGRAGIECFTVMGQLGNGEYREHAWNMVVIDGQTAYIDMCFSKALSKEEDDGMSFPLLLDLSAMEQIGYTPSWRPFAPSVLEGELSKYRRVKMIDKGKKVA